MLKFAVQRAKRTKQRLMTRTQKFDAKLKKAQVQKALVKADAERGTLALFSENEFAGSRGDALEVSCYCEK